ncbi:hypothetical protein M404DRAFT_1008807 [Pisolithus tinctorius Marx 270]|uniref:Uncharacterized protein n=1 Tax=Pisolithus tinctorius Marx 270 TaxID=870435 RepID=A0A0C3NDI7_PISTI|nr:hypothetical protein M404DRAFT_1008807 [Pisolithus tinctorius Marx 270]
MAATEYFCIGSIWKLRISMQAHKWSVSEYENNCEAAELVCNRAASAYIKNTLGTSGNLVPSITPNLASNETIRFYKDCQGFYIVPQPPHEEKQVFSVH